MEEVEARVEVVEARLEVEVEAPHGSSTSNWITSSSCQDFTSFLPPKGYWKDVVTGAVADDMRV